MSDKEWLFGLPVPNDTSAVAETSAIVSSSELPPAPEWSSSIVNALNVEVSENARSELKKLAAAFTTIPLATRIVDYVQSSILLATIARSAESLKKFARCTGILASIMAAELVDKDPRDLPDKDLQGFYKRMVERAKSIPNGGDTVRDLTSALRQFHSYMRNCHGKSRLRDQGILVPPVLVDRVDVDLLSRDEYLEIRRRIRLRWPEIHVPRPATRSHALGRDHDRRFRACRLQRANSQTNVGARETYLNVLQRGSCTSPKGNLGTETRII
jgi:hypothetical protein